MINNQTYELPEIFIIYQSDTLWSFKTKTSRLPVLSLIMMVVIRYISKVLVWILTILVIVGSIGNLQTFCLSVCVSVFGFVF